MVMKLVYQGMPPLFLCDQCIETANRTFRIPIRRRDGGKSKSIVDIDPGVVRYAMAGQGADMPPHFCMGYKMLMECECRGPHYNVSQHSQSV